MAVWRRLYPEYELHVLMANCIGIFREYYFLKQTNQKKKHIEMKMKKTKDTNYKYKR